MTLLVRSVSTGSSYQSSSVGNGLEYQKVESKISKVKEYFRSKPSVETTVFVHLLNSDISQLSERVERIRELFIDGLPVLSRNDIDFLKKIINSLSINSPGLSILLLLMRLLGPLLESNDYCEDAVEILVKLLRHERPEVRYAALESIGYALGETAIADALLNTARDILQDEQSLFVSDYLNIL